jgi:glutamine synthetase
MNVNRRTVLLGVLGATTFAAAVAGGARVWLDAGYPDPGANPYLAYAAMLMAGLDGIKNKIHPGDPMDKNLYELPPEELAQVPTVCGSLREALESLEADNDFLKAGDVLESSIEGIGTIRNVFIGRG